MAQSAVSNAVRDTRPAEDVIVPAAVHTPWCRNHLDGGIADQECQSHPVLTDPEAAADHGFAQITVATTQHQHRPGIAGPWLVLPASVMLATIDDDEHPVEIDLTPAEARKVASDLIRAAALAEQAQQ